MFTNLLNKIQETFMGKKKKSAVPKQHKDKFAGAPKGPKVANKKKTKKAK